MKSKQRIIFATCLFYLHLPSMCWRPPLLPLITSYHAPCPFSPLSWDWSKAFGGGNVIWEFDLSRTPQNFKLPALTFSLPWETNYISWVVWPHLGVATWAYEDMGKGGVSGVSEGVDVSKVWLVGKDS